MEQLDNASLFNPKQYIFIEPEANTESKPIRPANQNSLSNELR